MLRFQRPLHSALGMATVLAVASTAQAQFGSGCGCGTPAQTVSISAAAPCQSAAVCQTVMQPVAQACYQQVAVTEYHPMTQTVRRPKVESRVVNQDVVEYHPETEIHTVDVPVTTYQNVTEYQQVCKNVAYVHTRVEQNVRPSPCEYDNRRTAAGWMNRTAYEFRSMFVPKQTVRRELIPQTVMQTVPVTRRVACQSTKQVSYQTTKMVAVRSTRQVAVNHVSYEDVQTTVHVPRTVVRHVPIGSQMAFTPLGPTSGSTAAGSSPSSISLTPTPDSTMSRAPAQTRSATRIQKDNFTPDQNPNLYDDSKPIGPKTNKINYRPAPTDPGYHPEDRVTQSSAEEPAVARRSSPPSMVRKNQWVARTPKLPEGPTSDISLADVHRR